MRWGFAAVVVAGCGSNHAVADAQARDALDDGSGTSGDAATQVGQLSVHAGGVTVTSWSFAPTSVGANSATTLLVRNDSNASIALAASIPTSTISLDSAGSTCQGIASLEAGAYCHVRLVFAPSGEGSVDAPLTLTSGSTPITFPVHGVGIAAISGLFSDHQSVDFGVTYAGTPSSPATVLLENTGTATMPIDAFAVQGAGFALGNQNCPAALTPGGACSVTLVFNPSSPGPSAGTLTVMSGTAVLSVPLTGLAARVVTVTTSGGGTGTVTSTPNVQCGLPCIDNALGTIVFTATADSGSLFAGWQSQCGTQATCTVGPSVPVDLVARFELNSAKAIAVTFAGSGVGFVNINNTICTSSCTTYVAVGTTPNVAGYSPSTFVGWTGDCTGTAANCNLGTVINDRAVTATFSRDDREVATLFPPARIAGMAMMPGGDVVLSDVNGVSRMTMTGAIVWSTAIDGGAMDLATDSAGNVYGRDSAGVFALGPDGSVRWTHPAILAANPLRSVQSTISASSDGTVIAAHTSDGAVVLDGNGALRFAATALTSDGMAVAPDGSIGIGTAGTNAPALDVKRFDKTGASLPTIPNLPADRDASLYFDAQGALLGQTTIGGVTHVSRFSADGTLVFTNAEFTNFSVSPKAAIVAASTGDVIAMRGATDAAPPGIRLEVFSSTGTSTWTLSNLPTVVSFGVFNLSYGVSPVALAVDANKHFAVAGDYALGTPWVQIFALP